MGFIVRSALITVAIIPLLLYLYINNYFISVNFSSLEETNIKLRAGQALKGIDGQASELNKIARDYGIWDDMYEKLDTKDIAWFKQNVTNWLPQEMQIDLLLIADRNKRVVDQFGVMKGSEQSLLKDPIISNIIIEDYDKPKMYPSGLKIYQGELYIIAVSPVLKSYYKGTPRGILVLGRKITPKVISDMKQEYGNNVFISYNKKVVASPQEMPNVERYLNEFEIHRNKDAVQIGSTFIIGSSPIKDISGDSVGRLYIIEPRDLFESTLVLVHRTGYSVLALSIVVILLLSRSLKKIIVSPIKDLETQISQMAKGSFLSNVEVDGPQEITSLANAFNSLSVSLHMQKRENIDLRNVSVTDALTSLYNHRFFYEYLKSRIPSARKITILFGDIDYFRVVNDVHGHVVGDVILKEIGKIFKTVLTDDKKIFRYGGEEFAVVLEDYTGEEAFKTAEKIRIAVASNPLVQQYSGYFPVTLSIGMAIYPTDASKIETLVSKADRAMYFAKQSGRNQCKFYSPEIDNISGEDSANFTRKEMLIDSTYSLAAAIDAKDSYTEKHSEMVTKFALQLAEKMHLTEQDKYMLRIGGLLHDVGKIGLPDHIIHKTGPLTEEDWAIVKNHTLIGSNIAKYIIKAPEIDSCIRNHHERWDGHGYPDRLKDEEIPLLARIICIADSYHAMVSDRPYRKSRSQEEAFEELRLNSGTQFDPELVEKFIEALGEPNNRQSIPTKLIVNQNH